MDNRGLYRGKRLDNGKWVYGYYVGPVGCDPSHEICDINDISGSRIDVDATTVGQCTGLSASKSYRGEKLGNKLVFEHDIVSTPFGIAKAIWSEDYRRWLFIGINTNRILEPGKDFNGYEIKIIGNVFEPEVAEAKE